jgi:hypothetical protein
MAAPCARLQLVRRPVWNGSCGRPFNGIVSHHNAQCEPRTSASADNPAARHMRLGVVDSRIARRAPRCGVKHRDTWACRRRIGHRTFRDRGFGDGPNSQRGRKNSRERPGRSDRDRLTICRSRDRGRTLRALRRHVMANKTLERTVNHRGRTARAFAVVARAGVLWQLWPAVQHNR